MKGGKWSLHCHMLLTTPLLLQALSAGGLADPRHTRTPLEVALAAELCIHEWAAAASATPHRGGNGSAVGGSPVDPSFVSSYTRRSFMLWSLLAPDSEDFCGELRELVLLGGVGPDALARLEVPAAGGKG